MEACYRHYVLYRLVKNIELADYLASRRNEALVPRLKQAVQTWFYVKRDLDITWEDLAKMGLDEAEIRKDFAKEQEPLEEILKLVLGDQYAEMKNQAILS